MKHVIFLFRGAFYCPKLNTDFIPLPSTLKTAVMLLSLLAFLDMNRASAQCSCALVVGSGQGANVTNLSQVAAAQTVAGGCIRIKGTFYVDSGLTWDLGYNTQVYLDPGAGITVNNGCTLKADSGCVFTKCDPNAGKWGSITATTGSAIYLDSCKIHHGTTAVRILPNTTFWLTRNLIDSFSYGIKISGTQNPVTHQVLYNDIVNGSSAGIQISGNRIRINNNWFYDGNKAMIGIDITQGSQRVTINDCRMANLAIGVQAKSTLDEITLNGLIFGGDIGVSAQNCWLDFGIYRSNIRATQEGIWFNAHQTSLNGNPVQFGSVVIDGSYVSSISRSAIKLEKTYGGGRVHVRDNIIRPAYDPPSFGYYGIEINDVPNGQVFVERNEVDHLSYSTDPLLAPGGIYLYKCKRQNVVSDNKVTVGTNGRLTFGITIAQTPRCQVVGNQVDGGSPGMVRGISMENNQDSILLCCNYVNNSTKGLNMMGGVENCDISGTQFNVLDTALYYDMVTSFSAIQFHRGNDWSAASTTWDAYFNGNANFIPFTRYYVDYSFLANTNKVSVNGGGNTNNWFTLENDSEDTCGSAAYCGHTPYQPGFSGGGEEFLTGSDYWAINTLDDDYVAIHWETQRQLYEKLVKNSDLLNESAEITDFYETAESGNIGMFYIVEDGLSRLYEPSETIAEDYYTAHATLASLNADLDALDEEIAEAEAWELPDLLDDRDDLVVDIETAGQSLAVFDSIIVAAIPGKLYDLREINSSIEPDADYEAYQQIVNALYFGALIGNDWDFDSGEQEDIDEIAALCPLYAGRAVYEARALQEYYRVPVWNDCSLIEERNTQPVRKMKNGFSVYPNPASDLVILAFDQDVPASSEVVLLNLAGQAVYRAALPENTRTWQLSLASLPNGSYFIQAQTGTSSHICDLNIIR